MQNCNFHIKFSTLGEEPLSQAKIGPPSKKRVAFSAENLEQLRRNALRVHFPCFLVHFWGPGACLALPLQHFS